MVPNPIIELGNLKVYLYGLFIGIGILLCIGVLFLYTKKMKMDSKVQNFIFFVAIIAIAGGFGFAKLFQAIYDLIKTGTFDFLNAGITAMGGFVGGAAIFIAVYFGIGKVYFKKYKPNIHVKQFNIIAKVAPCCITIAHAFGRIGCLMSGCCHGAYLGQDYVVGGIWMRPPDTNMWGYYVPTQLYEAVFLFVLFAVLTVLLLKGFNVVHGVYLISYGIWRILIELLRTDERGGVVLGLQPSQWQSILFIVGGVALFVVFICCKIPIMLPKEQKEAVVDGAVEEQQSGKSQVVQEEQLQKPQPKLKNKTKKEKINKDKNEEKPQDKK